MIKPHGSESLNPLYVEDDAKRAELMKEAGSLPSITICSAAAWTPCSSPCCSKRSHRSAELAEQFGVLGHRQVACS